MFTPLKRLRNLPWQALSKQDHALPDYLLGLLRERADDPDSARLYFQSSIRRWNHPDNPAKAALKELRQTDAEKGDLS